MSVTKPTCRELPNVPAPLRVTLPLGIAIQSMPTGQEPISTQLNTLQSVFTQLAPALAAFQPIFVLVDTVVAIKDTFTAIPGLIVGDVDTFLNALNRVAEGVSKLTGVIPALAIPNLVRDCIVLIRAGIAIMVEILDEISAIEQDAADAIAAAQSLPAAYKADAISTGQCLQSEAAKRLEHTVNAIGPMAQLLNVLNLLGSLANIPGLPVLGDLTGKSTQEVKEALEALDEVLQALPL
ncbi:MAG: hypothetical protein GTN69_01890 [Armatimonadetes bacterium]|nr:hypothetical protein [Armatimonadota bacterium]